MNAGFYDEAKGYIEKGESQKDVSENIPLAKSSLREIFNREKDKKKDYLKIGQLKWEFQSSLAEHAFLQNIKLAELVGIYSADEISAELICVNTGFELSWKSNNDDQKELKHSIFCEIVRGQIGTAQYQKPQFKKTPYSFSSEEVLTYENYKGAFYFTKNSFRFLMFKKDSLEHYQFDFIKGI